MTTELTFLLYSTLLMFVLILIPASIAILENGLLAQAGPRDNLPEPSALLKRAIRLRDNMLENMVIFTGVVLIAHAAGVSNNMTVLGTQVFLFARIIHAVIYLVGLPLIRPLAWGASIVGVGLIVLQLL